MIERLLRFIITMSYYLISILMTKSVKNSRCKKLVCSIFLVSVFGVILIILRLWLMWRGPLVVKTVTTYGASFTCDLPDFIQMYLYFFDVGANI